jgi:hypothetical protein
MQRLPVVLLTALTSVSAGMLSTVSQADENLFGYVYGSETLPKGKNEAYIWITQREDKGIGSYSATDVQLELEHGFTDRLQGSVYLTANRHHASGITEIEQSMVVNSFPDVDRGLTLNGVKASLKYNMLSPFKDGVGLALYWEPTYSTIYKVSGEKIKQYGFENKLLLQKNFMDDRLITAYNATIELEKRTINSDNSKEFEIEWEQTFGVSYRVVPKLFTGVEFRNHTEWPDGVKEHQAYFMGPTVHYGDKDWWLTATWLPQIKGGSPIDPARSQTLHLGEHEKNEYRLKLGYNF